MGKKLVAFRLLLRSLISGKKDGDDPLFCLEDRGMQGILGVHLLQFANNNMKTKETRLSAPVGE